jgi:hypothetical protein
MNTTTPYQSVKTKLTVNEVLKFILIVEGRWPIPVDYPFGYVVDYVLSFAVQILKVGDCYQVSWITDFRAYQALIASAGRKATLGAYW